MRTPSGPDRRPDELVAALEQLDAADTLAGVLDQVRQGAAHVGLAVFPAVPEEGGHEVVVGPEQMPWGEFLEFATPLHAAVLYVASTEFNSDAFADPDGDDEDEDDAEAHQKIRQALARFDGLTERLDIAVIHQGAWHRWTDIAPFAAGVLAAFDAVAREAEEAELSAVDTERIVDELLADPKFRISKGRPIMFKVVREFHPNVDALVNRASTQRAAMKAISNACDAVFAERQDYEQDLERRLPELARQLAQTKEFRAAASPAMRRTIAARFLADKANGHPMPTGLRDDLALRAHRAQRDRE